MSRFFINRPIFASVISIIIVIAGLVAAQVLPIAQYPQIAPPTVMITATYPGASAETLAKTVAAPIEEQLNGVEHLAYFTSSASANGSISITATFDVGTDVDDAAVNVNNLTRSAPLGRTLSEQYASHMSALGFNVKEVKLRGDLFVREGTGELLLSRELRDIARSQNAAVVLVGTYSPATDYTYVSVKLVRTEDSRILRGHDYALPNDRDVQRLLQEPVFR